MSDGQIEKATEDFRASLRKYRGEFDRGAVQWVLGLRNPTLGATRAFYDRVKAISDMPVRHVKMSSFNRRHRTLEEAALSSGLELQGEYWGGENAHYRKVNFKDVEVVPRFDYDEVTLYFFNHSWIINDAELERQYAWRGLKPADPFSVLALREMEPDFQKKFPKPIRYSYNDIYTHWRNSQGKWSYLALRDDDLTIDLHTSTPHPDYREKVEAEGGTYTDECTFFVGVRNN